jgi:hypothetical protein
MGALAISLCSASDEEYANVRRAARRESELYGIDPDYVASRMEGRATHDGQGRTWRDFLLIGAAVAIFVWLGTMASIPHMEFEPGWLGLFAALLVAVLAAGGFLLWRITKFS